MLTHPKMLTTTTNVCARAQVMYVYLSRMKLALAKQNVAEVILVIKRPESLLAMGYCIMLQKMSVPGTLPNSSVLGLIDITITFPNDITTCIFNIHQTNFNFLNT